MQHVKSGRLRALAVTSAGPSALLPGYPTVAASGLPGYESVGMMAEAAGAYEAGESWAAAGGVYIRAGLKERAAAAYEKAGELETAAGLYHELGNASRAADLFARAGLTFRSGEAAARAGEREKAIGLLQRVAPSDENFRAATELLARLFIETGRPALAIEKRSTSSHSLLHRGGGKN